MFVQRFEYWNTNGQVWLIYNYSCAQCEEREEVVYIYMVERERERRGGSTMIT